MKTRLRNIWRPWNFHYHRFLSRPADCFEGWTLATALAAMSRPCTESVTLTAQNPPSRVYSRISPAPRSTDVVADIWNVVAKALPAAWNWAAAVIRCRSRMIQACS